MTAWKDRKQYTDVDGVRMAHVEEGAGPPVLFLHGNPTSSFLWRDVMAAMSGAGSKSAGHRLIAPDLVGMGDSWKLRNSGPDRYTLAEHGDYLDGWIAAQIPNGKVTLVLHDWGGPLGFRWARMNPDRVHAIAYMETVLRPMTSEEWPETIRGLFNAMRSRAGEDMVLEKNVFVDRILPGSILRDLDPDEMAEYRRPFTDPGESRRPTLTWPRQIPLDGHPAESTEIVTENWAWFSTWDGPKLLIDAEPGAIMKGAILQDARSLSQQSEMTVRGSHFIQEDSGAEIGQGIADWLAALD